MAPARLRLLICWAALGSALARGLSADEQQALLEDADCGGTGESQCDAASWLQLRAQKSAANTSRGESCPTDTGGSCFLFSCDRSRGPTRCVKRKCICEPGYCNNRGACMEASYGDNGAQQGIGLEPLCNAETGSSCLLFGCPGWHGPTSCTARRCTCSDGHCSINGICHRNMHTFSANVVPVLSPRDAFPDGQGGVSTALCFSGGGTRSQAASLGYLRALTNLGLMPLVDTISSVSGGTWAAGLYMFVDMDAEKALGKATDPASLTMSVLDQKPPPLLATSTNKLTPVALSYIAKGMGMSPDLWIASVAETFLKPFGLDSRDSYMAPDAATVERIKQQNPQLQNATFHVPRADRNLKLIMSGALLAPTGYVASNQNVISLQMSPDYTGSPFYPDSAAVGYDSEHGRNNEQLNEEVAGGGFVESFAFGGLAPPEGQRGGEGVKMAAPLEPLSLAKALGVSSAGPASALTQLGPHGAIDLAALTPRTNYWPILSEKYPGPQGAATYQLGDGGNIDNTGVLAALQRKAKRVVSFWNTQKALPDKAETNFCNMTHMDSEALGKLDTQIRSLFGYMEVSGPGEFLARNQVFERSKLQAVICDLQTLRDQGRPALLAQRMQVVENTWWGIPAMDKVDFLFVYNAKCGNFEASLPEETREALGKRWGELEGFPHYQVIFHNPPEATALTNRQANLLAAQAEYFVATSEPLFRKFLASGTD